MQNVRFNRIIEMLNNEPQDAFLLYALAQEYLNMAEYEKAINVFEKLLQLHPKTTAAYLHYGNTFLQLQQLEKAIDIYQQGIAMCQQQQAFHDLRELQAALNNLID